MIDRRDLLLSLGSLPFAGALAARQATTSLSRWPVPPQHRREPRVVGNFGHRRNDDYAWMRPKDWHAVLRDPASLDLEIKEAVLAENAYTAAMMRPSAPLRARLIQRVTAIEAGAAAPVEIRDGDHFYYERKSPAGDPIYARRPVNGGAEQVLLDVGAEAKGKAFYSTGWLRPQRSADGRLFGWAADETGSGIFTVRIREMSSGHPAGADITNVHSGFTFSPDGRHVYWVVRSDQGRPMGVKRRDVAAGTDAPVYEESDPGFFIDVRTSASGRFVVIRTFNGEMSEIRLIAMSDPTGPAKLMEPRRAGVMYDVDDWNGRLLVLTDADGAADFKLMTASEAAPDRAGWRELVPHVPGRLIKAIHPFATHLVREEWRDAMPRLVVMSPDGGEKEVSFDEPAYALEVPAGQSFRAAQLAFVYQSPRLPPSPQRLDLASGSAAPASEPASTAAYDPTAYEVHRIQAHTADGVDVPITVLMRKGTALDGSAPLYLYAYGSYGATVEAEFSPAMVALVDQGWIYAIAHVRGGAERGSAWWRSVLKHGKKKTFTDFIDCAELLIARKYTAKKRIVAHGLSAGGLLMGAVYTMRPDLWAGVIAQVPFVDVLNTMDDFETHPLGTSALPIWGDPRVPEDYAYISSYSPYDHLVAAPYPALLTTGGVADDRVAFWEPVKFVVKTRALTMAANPIMAKVSMTGGHSGDSGSQAAREQQALFCAFAIWAADRLWGDVPQKAG